MDRFEEPLLRQSEIALLRQFQARHESAAPGQTARTRISSPVTAASATSGGNCSRRPPSGACASKARMRARASRTEYQCRRRGWSTAAVSTASSTSSNSAKLAQRNSTTSEFAAIFGLAPAVGEPAKSGKSVDFGPAIAAFWPSRRRNEKAKQRIKLFQWVIPRLGNRGKSPGDGGYTGWPRHRIRSAKQGTGRCPAVC